MNAVPAKVAGVPRMVMVVPSPDGKLNPLVLAAAHLGGVSEIYRVGGAQAVAALAYGTATIAPVAKIVGPGNAYVAAAKRLVFGKVGIDMIAGPSEVLVIADRTGNADWIAADLLAQAEHDVNAQSILITDSPALADEVERAVESQLRTLPRASIAQASWKEVGAIILVKKIGDAIELANAIAAEHLEIMTSDPEALSAQIRNAGAIFLGSHTPEAIGDYVGGSNHVLPTARSARFSSGLGVLDFMKRTSILKCGPDQLRALGPAAMTLGNAEGLDAHARSVGLHTPQPVMARKPPEEDSQNRIVAVTLDEESIGRSGPDIEHERAIAVYDLVEKNLFAPEGAIEGRSSCILAVTGNRLMFDIRREDGSPVVAHLLSLTPFRRIVKDYFMICDSYYQAIRAGTPDKIEAIDMGRRGIHDEARARCKSD